MSVPLVRLQEYELTRPEPGAIALGVARHEAAAWHVPDIHQYEVTRAKSIKELVGATGIPVAAAADIGEPREAVETILFIGPPLISAVVGTAGSG